MLSYHGHYEDGRIIPLGNPVIPEGSEIIFTVLEPSEKNRSNAKTEFLRDVYRRLEASEKDFESGRVKDAFQSLEELRTKHGL